MLKDEDVSYQGRLHTSEYLRAIGVADLPPLTSPFDPGYDRWMVAKEGSTRRKLLAAKKYDVPTVTGGGPFEIAVAQGRLPEYLDLCADIGVTRVECGEGFTDLTAEPKSIVRMAHERKLEVQFELGKKHGGAFTEDAVNQLIAQGRKWLDAGAIQLVLEARESARGVGLFDEQSNFNNAFADRFAEAFGLNILMYEAPNKPSQFALLDHFGHGVHLCNVRLEELLRVEIYRRGIHSDAFRNEQLRPRVTVLTSE